jgi:beta-alanine degradation protein BauB
MTWDTRFRLRRFLHQPICVLALIAAGALSSASGAPARSTLDAAPTRSAVLPAGSGRGLDAGRGVTSEPLNREQPDPTRTDPDKYQTLLENQQVRVLRYRDEPGAKTHLHHHPNFVLIALSHFRRRLTFVDGSTKERDFAPGDVLWMKDQMHIGQNTGTTDTQVVIVELKAR